MGIAGAAARHAVAAVRPPLIYLGPFVPRSTRDAAFAMGMASALCDLLNRRGVPMSVLDPGDIDFADLENQMLHLVGIPDGSRVVVGTVELDASLSLSLAVVDVARRAVMERHLIEEARSLDDAVAKLATWIGKFGIGIEQSIEPEPAPTDFRQLRTQALAYGLEWHVQRAPSLSNDSLLADVDRTARHFEQHITDAFAGRRLRGMVLLAMQIMLDRCEADDIESTVATRELLAAIDRGLRDGADRQAFGFCKGHVLAMLGRTDEAVAVYRALASAPLHAHYFCGRALEMAQRLEEAASAYRAALRFAGERDEFVDLARSSDAEPTGEQERWRPLVEATLAQTLVSLDQHDAAEPLLRDALRHARNRLGLLESLASMLQVRLDRERPPSARWRQRAAIYLDALADLHAENPSHDIVAAAVELAAQLEDAGRLHDWQTRAAAQPRVEPQ